MTVTMEPEVSTVVVDGRARFTLPLTVVRDLLAGGMVAVSKDSTLPTLCTIRWEYGAGDGTVRVVSTDRYRLVIGDYFLPSGDTPFFTSGAGEFLMSGMDAKQLLKSLPRVTRGNHNDVVTFDIGESVVTVEWGSGVYLFRPVDGEFPKYRSLVPAPLGSSSVEVGLPDGMIALNGDYLSSLGDIPVNRNQPWRFAFHGPTRPALAITGNSESGTIDWGFLIMPVKLYG